MPCNTTHIDMESCGVSGFFCVCVLFFFLFFFILGKEAGKDLPS